MKLSVSYFKSDYSLPITLEKIGKTDAEYIHCDISDGIFIDRVTDEYSYVSEFLKNTNKALDIHFMVDNPIKYIIDYSKLKPEIISIHYEIKHSIDDLLDLIHSYNIKAGIVINPETPVKDIHRYLDKVDNVLIMSVKPGLGGQKFMMSVLEKIDELYKFRKDNNLNYTISIDGGVNDEVIKYLSKVDIIISGSFICCSKDYQQKINILRNNFTK